MKITKIITTAAKALKANKIRTALTVLGIVIGIASVIVVFAAGEGINNLVIGQIESYGTDIAVTEVRVPNNKKGMANDSQSGMAMAQGVQVTTLKIADMQDIDKIDNVKQSYSALMSQEVIAYENETKKAYIMGVSPAYIDIDKGEIDFGHFFSKNEDDSLDQVVVLGKNVRKVLFGENDPIGKFIKIKKKKFQVIGVMKERGAVMGVNYDDYIYIPVKTLQKKLMGVDYVLYMIHQLKDMNQAEATAEEIRYVLTRNHEITEPGKEDFRVTTMGEMMEMMGTVTNAMTLLLLAIVAISLVVGGVGIMNIMYVVVTERTAEIGLRKAVGASYDDIMKQFLLEAIIITSLGGVVGIVVGVIISLLISWGAKAYGFDWNFTFQPLAFITALGFSIFFGIFFGIYPARKAARLNPIEALRAE